MKLKAVLLGGLVCAAAIGLSAVGASAAVTIKYYTSFTDTGSGVSVTGGPFAVGAAPSLLLGDNASSAVNTAANWPGAGNSFAAIIDEAVSAPTAGMFNVTLTSDDASYLFVNGVLALSNGGSHSITPVTGNIALNAGLNMIEVQYDNTLCCNADVELSGLTLATVPEPASWALMLAGLGCIGGVIRTRRRPDMSGLAA